MKSDFKTCYIISFWLGDRRRKVKEFIDDNLYYLKCQLSILNNVKHNLTKIIFNFNVIPEHYHHFSEILKLIPKSIQGSEVEINIRDNYGMSYGAWSDLFEKYRQKYDYYIFAEDDYFFIENNWDTYLVNKHNQLDNCGYLCMMVREPHEWNDFRKIAGSSVGIASSETLQQIYEKYGRLPSQKKEDLKSNDFYEEGKDIQNQFGYSFIEIGKNIYDVRDDYKVMFAMGGPPEFPNVDVWILYQWNEKFINVPDNYFREYHWFISAELEFSQDYKPLNVYESKYCHENKLPYFESNKESSRREFPI